MSAGVPVAEDTERPAGWWSAPVPGAVDRHGEGRAADTGGGGLAQPELPAITLPKGGGAIRGLDEKLSVNQATGTATMTVGVFTSTARNGFGPTLSLSYDSASGNGPFGLGWSIPVGAVTRKTSTGLPRYHDEESADSDVFVLASGEELVPRRDGGVPDELVRDSAGRRYAVRRYRPRVESAFSRIERWSEVETGVAHWRVISRANVTSLYGRHTGSRIADPADPRRVFSWLIDLAFDDRGNAIEYEYKPDDLVDVPGSATEAGRVTGANRYLKRIRYGNQTPYRPAAATSPPLPADWCFELVVDYGEHDLDAPTPAEDRPWQHRPDPLSSYRSCFEIRTLRRCRRFLMFHRFAELGPDPVLVRSTDLTYHAPDADPALPSYSLLGEITQTGWIGNGIGGYTRASLPSTTLGYTPLTIDQTQHVADARATQNVGGTRERFIDVNGEGLRGLLVEDEQAWYYKRNVSAWTPGGGRPAARFEPLTLLADKPTGGDYALSDLNGEGRLCAVKLAPPEPGWYEYDPDSGWSSCRQLAATANIDWSDGNLRLADVTGDGLADTLVSEDDAFVWNAWIRESGFAPAERVPKPHDEDTGPRVMLADPTGCLFLADMSGDGLSDLVRIRNREICYWPNLGYGRFAAKVVMDCAPAFDLDDQFDARRIRLADIDGSGTADLVYLGAQQTTVWFNQCGASWTAGRVLVQAPRVDNDVELEVLDLLGTGTACLVWISTLPDDANRVLRYVDLTGSAKPYLLSRIANGFGGEREVDYAPSTRFYVEDRAAGRPWLTRLPFPVHLVERLRTVDRIAGTTYTSRYSYHHGFYDPVEREFRGFGRIDVYDTDEVPSASGMGEFTRTPRIDDDEFVLPPVLTRTWLHTGAVVDSDDLAAALRREHYRGDLHAPTPRPTVLPPSAGADEVREAYRALRGRVLREEVYSLDGTALAEHPHVVRDHSYEVDRLQKPAGTAFGSYHPWERENVTCTYERHPDDPRITHSMTLAVDAWGDVTRKAAVAYPRRARNRAFPEQAATAIVYTEADFAQAIVRPDALRAGLPSERRDYELTGLTPLAEGELYDPSTVADVAAHAIVLPYEARSTGQYAERRLLARYRTIYRSDNLAEALPLGHADARAIIDRAYTQRYTPGLLAAVFGDRVGAGTPDDSALVDLDRDGNLWAPTGETFYSPDPLHPDVDFATQHFFLPQLLADPWGNFAQVSYDAYNLLPVTALDPVGNATLAQNNYRVLHPWLITDANGNRAGVRFDALGMMVASASMGKPLRDGADEGDHLDLSTPESSRGDDPTTWFDYDLDAYGKWAADPARDARRPEPAWARRRARVSHGRPDTAWVAMYAYTDGSGRVAMTKEQAEPGDAPCRNRDGELEFGHCDDRWVGSGRIVYDNKGNKVKAYEPFFDCSPRYETEADLVEWGVTAITRYDPLGRAIRVDLPDGTLRRVEFDAWRTVTWDQDDTVLDSDWYAARIDGGLGAREQDAARKAATAAGTPSTADLDPLGRTFRTTSDNGKGGKYSTVVTLDIQSHPLVLNDALGRAAMTRNYDMGGGEIFSSSIDNGDRRVLLDAGRQTLRTWDSRGHIMRIRYDALRRPTKVLVASGASPTLERLAEAITYGEGVARARQLNLRGIAIAHRDEAGLVTTDARDFDGNVLATTRRILASVLADVDWQADPALDPERFTTTTQFDALGRAVAATTPDGSTTANTFNARGLIAAVHASTADAPPIAIIEAAEYDAKRRRVHIRHGNGAVTDSEYDPEAMRLVRLVTKRQGIKPRRLQDLRYTYDAVGNVTHVTDAAQPKVFFDNQAVPPGGDFTYDPLYRLVCAVGREHIGQLGAAPVGRHDHARIVAALPAPGDNTAMRTYRERYLYDEVGNIQRVRHQAADGNWTRHYRYGDGDTPDGNNRLASTSAAGIIEPYTYDEHGNLTAMPHLGKLTWDWKDQLRASVAQHRHNGDPESTQYTYDSARARIVKQNINSNGRIVAQRIYLGTCEIYQAYHADGRVSFERRTLHVGDGMKRTCIIESTVSRQTTDFVLRYQFSDLLGSSVVELDKDAAVISYEEYYPYGSTSFAAGRSRTEIGLKRYRYTGKERDEESGFYYYGARYYVPWLGRWTQPDPAGLVDGLNLYAFAHDNPVSWNDGDGRDCDPSNATCLDPNDAHNYGTLEDFRRGVRGPLSDEGIIAAWDEAHPQIRSEAPPPPPTASADATASATATATETGQTAEPPHRASGWARWGVGTLQVLGGAVEVVGGFFGGAATCLETIGGGCVVGVLAMGHGADTFTSGIGTMWSGNISQTYTARAGSATARELGASPTTQHWVGVGVDVTVGLGTSLGTGLVRQAAIEGSTESATAVTLGFLPRGPLDMGHNVVGITRLAGEGEGATETATTFWHLVGAPGQQVKYVPYITDAAQLGQKGYVLTRIGVAPAAANEALAATTLVPRELLQAGGGTAPMWGYLGPNCTTTAAQVLRSAGVSVPAFARTPMLIYAGVNYGWAPVTVVTTPVTATVTGAASNQ